MMNMHASWKIASSALFALVLAGAGGCAAGDDAEDAASAPVGEATLAAQEACGGWRGADPQGPPRGPAVVVIINENGKDDTGIAIGGHGRHHGHGHQGCGSHGGHHGDHCGSHPGMPDNSPATPPPPPPPAQTPVDLGQSPS
jgi:hypothetical protein